MQLVVQVSPVRPAGFLHNGIEPARRHHFFVARLPDLNLAAPDDWGASYRHGREHRQHGPGTEEWRGQVRRRQRVAVGRGAREVLFGYAQMLSGPLRLDQDVKDSRLDMGLIIIKETGREDETEGGQRRAHHSERA